MTYTTFGAYTRISKARARKLYNAGEAVYIAPCNMRPDNMYQPAVRMPNWSSWPDASGGVRPFDDYIAEYEYYNCDKERGRYPSYWLKAE